MVGLLGKTAKLNLFQSCPSKTRHQLMATLSDGEEDQVIPTLLGISLRLLTLIFDLTFQREPPGHYRDSRMQNHPFENRRQ
jgi:hypothetical protein